MKQLSYQGGIWDCASNNLASFVELSVSVAFVVLDFFRDRFEYQVVERRDFNPVAWTLIFSFDHTPAIYLKIVIWLLRLSEFVQHDGLTVVLVYTLTLPFLERSKSRG